MLYSLFSDGDTTTAMPDWVYSHWKHTHTLYGRVGGCTAVGFYDRKNQITAVNCNNEVADVICQPSS